MGYPARIRIVAVPNAQGMVVRGQDVRLMLVHPDGTEQDLTKILPIMRISWEIGGHAKAATAQIEVHAEIDADLPMSLDLVGWNLHPKGEQLVLLASNLKALKDSQKE